MRALFFHATEPFFHAAETVDRLRPDRQRDWYADVTTSLPKCLYFHEQKCSLTLTRRLLFYMLYLPY